MQWLASSPFGMIIAIVGICTVAGLIKEMHKARLEHRSGSKEVVDAVGELAEKFEKIERRMANIESIVIEHEKVRNFEDALGDSRD